MTWNDAQPYAIGGAFALFAWVVRTLVFDAIKELRDANVRQGKRLGELEKWQAAHDAVRDHKRERVRTAAGGTPIGGDEP